jgi:serine/threonine protein kinase
MDNLIGQSFERYQILEQLGEGGMAIVYKAYDTRLERDVAIKIIKHDAFPPNQLERILRRFEREAKSLAKLSHTNIVGVIDYGEYKGSPYLVMEYLPGGSLKQRLGNPISWQETVRLLIPIANALEYAHEHNIIHRDIKPSNILLTEKGQPMLTDFGIAKILENQDVETLTGTGIGVGTPEYMAPEQWTGQTTTQSDIYSLGVVFYEMVTGRKPYEGDTPAEILLKQATEPLPNPKVYAPNLPEEVEKILLKSLAKKSNDRYQDIPALINTLEKLAAKGLNISTQETRVGPDEPVDEFDTQTKIEPFERTPIRTPAFPRRLPTFIRGGTWAVAILFIVFGGYFLLNGLSNGERKPDLQIVKSETPYSTDIPNPTYTPYPTNTPYPTETHVPKPTATPIVFNPQADSSDYIDAFGVPMRLVPAGEFTMGTNTGKYDDSKPAHQVYLDAYYIDKYEVTNVLYRACVDAGVCQLDDLYSIYDATYENLPVVRPSWSMARTYCEWRGAQLPSEAQWEKAARGTDGRPYPWGEGIDQTKANYNYQAIFTDIVGDLVAVGSYESGASPYGLYDMAGNVWEWTLDWYSETYYQNSPPSNPLGPASGQKRVVRGGSFVNSEFAVSTTTRDGATPTFPEFIIGFRCFRAP